MDSIKRLSGKSRKSYSFFSFYLLSPFVDLLYIYQKWHCGNTNSCTFFGKQQKQLHHLSRLASNIRMQHLQAEAVAFSLSFCNFSAPRNVMPTSKILNKKATQHHANLHVEKMLGLDFAEVGCTNLCLKISTLRTNQFYKHRWVTPENYPVLTFWNRFGSDDFPFSRVYGWFVADPLSSEV